MVVETAEGRCLLPLPNKCSKISASSSSSSSSWISSGSNPSARASSRSSSDFELLFFLSVLIVLFSSAGTGYRVVDFIVDDFEFLSLLFLDLSFFFLLVRSSPLDVLPLPLSLPPPNRKSKSSSKSSSNSRSSAKAFFSGFFLDPPMGIKSSMSFLIVIQINSDDQSATQVLSSLSR